MSKSKLTDSQIVQQKYRDITNAWMNIHLLILTGTILVSVVMEFLIYFVLGPSQISSSPVRYILRYILAPLGLNLTLLIAALLIRRKKGLSESLQVGAVSLATAGTALTLYTVHSFFPAMILALVVPVVLTILYGRVRLTALTSAVCIGGKLISDLFFQWDPDVAPISLLGAASADQVVCLVLLLFCCMISLLLVRMDRQRMDFSLNIMLEQQRLREKTVTDSLTRVGNRRALREALQKMERHKNGRWFFIMMDMDQFKQINDEFGHSRGDYYLQSLGRILLRYEGDTFQPFRFGGDEFCAILHGRDAEETVAFCRRLQSDYARIVAAENDHLSCGISIGVTACHPGESAQMLLNQADRALYRAKATHCGSICIWGSELEKAE